MATRQHSRAWCEGSACCQGLPWPRVCFPSGSCCASRVGRGGGPPAQSPPPMPADTAMNACVHPSPTARVSRAPHTSNTLQRNSSPS